MLSITELKEIKKQLDKGYSVSFPNTSLSEYRRLCKEINEYLSFHDFQVIDEEYLK